ncbi:MAG: roadblock/LC7 domain-containing protein [Candidatus Bathyarchaeia archaeon]
MPKRKTPETTLETQPIEITLETETQTLRNNLDNLKNKEGVIGYILRNSKSASIDLKDPTKIIDYAIISSTAHETGENLSKIFNLGGIQKILMEGENTKILTLRIGENQLSIFLEKTVDPEKILQETKLT